MGAQSLIASIAGTSPSARFDVTGTSWKDTYPFLYAQMIDAVGDRPLGMEAAQLIRITRWASQGPVFPRSGSKPKESAARALRLWQPPWNRSCSPRSSYRNGMHSLSYLLDAPVKFEQAPELFCLDLFKYFDIDSLEAMPAPAEVRTTHYVEGLQ